MHSVLRILCLALVLALPIGARAIDVPEPAPAITADAKGTPLEVAALTPRARPATAEAPAAPICRMIEAAAREAALDPPFFARLIWRESLFDPAAVSPKGAQGIAQFMPGTAELRGLDDAFDPQKALQASARYLADLTRDFGNLGLAAAAYNGGEARLARYVTEGGDLPEETRAYVAAITGHGVGEWRDAPPSALDLALRGATFHEGCLALAASRGRRDTVAEPPLAPWGVIIASNRARDGARRQVERLVNRHADVLAGEQVRYSRGGSLGRARGLMVAQVGRESREAAETFCGRLRAAGGDCIVLRN